MLREARAIASSVRARWRSGHKPWITIGAVIATLVFWTLRRAGVWSGPIDALSVVRADQPLLASLLRVPLSILVPAPNLPVWGAVVQVAVVGAISEALLGRRRLVGLALGSQYVATLAGRIAAWIGGAHVYGLRPAAAFVRDTGPSAVVITAGLTVLVLMRARWLAAITSTVLLIEIIGLHTLAGREHLVAIVLGVAMGIWWRKPRRSGPARVAAGVFAAFAAVLASGVIDPTPVARLQRIALAFSPASGASPSRLVCGLAAFWFVLVAGGLRRGQRAAWWLALGTSVLSIVAPANSRGAHGASAVGVLLLVLLIAGRRSFPAVASRSARRRTWVVVAVIVSVVAILPLFPERFDRQLSSIVATLLVAAVGLASWWWTRPTETVFVAELDYHRARLVVQRHGFGTLDYFALRDDKSWFFWGSSVVAYAVHGSVALVSPDPIGPVNERAVVWAQFVAFASEHGWTVTVLAASAQWLPIYAAHGMHALYIGDEAVIDCDDFRLDGGERKSLRQAVHRVERNCYTMTFHRGRVDDVSLQSGIESLLAASRRGEAERGFSMTLGRVFSPKDRDLLLAVAHGPDGRPVAFCQFVPQGGQGWSLDVMRSERTGHPNGLLDYVIVETTKYLAAQRRGQQLCLNFATMRMVLSDEAPNVARRMLRRVLHRAGESMQIESLWRFNSKFGPTWRPRYVVYPAMVDLPSAAFAIAQAEAIVELPVIGRFVRSA